MSIIKRKNLNKIQVNKNYEKKKIEKLDIKKFYKRIIDEDKKKDMKNKIIASDGSIQSIEGIPQIFKERYKTVWEMSQKDIIDMAVDRGKYICQSQSLNLFMAAPDTNKMSSMHMYAWRKGLKTGLYYLRTRPSSKALQFTVKPDQCEACSG